MKSRLSSLWQLLPPALLLCALAVGGGWLMSGSPRDPSDKHSQSSPQTEERQTVSSSPLHGRVKSGSQSLSADVLASEATASALFQILETLPHPVLTGMPPEGEVVPNALLMLESSSVIDPSDLEGLSKAKPGQEVGFPTPKGLVRATVRARQKDAAGHGEWVSGVVGTVADGSFAVHWERSVGSLRGHLLLQRSRKAYIIEPDPTGRLLLQERPIDAVICAGMPPEPNPIPLAVPRGVVKLADPVPILDSLPSALGVLYIDFDGQVVTDPAWNGGQTINAQPAVMAGQPMTAAQMTAVWAAVAEDFAAFNVSVTTSLARYNAAPANRRMRCIQTPTKDAAPSAGGVAYLNSFSNGNDTPCWSFNSNNVRVMAMTISHELGHTVGLSHDGRVAPNQEEYYGGHGTGATRWGPLMGAPFSAAVTQWSKGEYYLANRTTQDDLAVITRTQNFGYRADEAADTPATASDVADIFFGNVDESGFITNPADKDVYRFTTAGGAVSLTGQASALPEANLDIKLRILRQDGSEVALADPAATLSATLSTTLTVGTYFIEVSGSGFGDPLANPPTGYTNYGSLGAYRLTGTFVPLPQVPLITEQPVSPATPVIEGRGVSFQVSVISNRTPRYQWIKVLGGEETNIAGATSRTFTIPAVNASHIADYKVRISNSVGPVESQVASLGVFLRPRFTVPPVGGKVRAGDPLILTPTITGSQPMTLQWFKDGTPIVGATGSSLNIASAKWSDAGSYWVVGTNAAGTSTSAKAQVAIESPPVVIQELPLFAVRTGSTAKLTLSVRGTPPYLYQWVKDDQDIPGATSATLSLRGDPTLTPGVYKLRVINGFGVSTSLATQVVVDDPVVITQHPVGASNLASGAAFSMSVAVSGTLPQFQWQLNGKDIPGATSSTLTLDPLNWFHNGRFQVVVSNRVSRVVSRAAVVSVTSAPVILTHPTSRKAARRGTTTFTVKAQGTGKLRYQWLKGGVPIARATGASLRLTRLDTVSEGEYQVLVGNALGETLSGVGNLIVEDVPTIVTQPAPAAFQVNSTVTLSVGVAGSPAFRYQWQRNKRDLVGQTGASLAIPNSQLTDTALYRVMVTNDVGRAISREVKATVMLPPTIITQLQPVSQYQGFNATFTVKAGGTGPFTYRWRKDGVEIQTTTTPTLTLRNLRLDQAGDYSVQVVNAVNSALSDEVALDVLVVPPPTIVNHVPRRGQAKDKVALIGNNLRFAKSATLAGKSVSFVVTLNNDVVVTTPSNAVSGALRVTTPGGSATTTSNFTVATDGFQNDNFANSIVVTTGTYAVENVNTRDYTAEPGEPGYFANAEKSAWWRWTCPKTGSYEIDTKGSSYDTVMSVFSGDRFEDLIVVARNDDADLARRDLHSRVVVNGIQGAVYRISVDAYNSRASYRADLNIRPLAASPVAGDSFEPESGVVAGGSILKEGGWQGVGAAVVVEDAGGDQAVLLGGSTSSETAQIWHPALDESSWSSGEVTTAFSAWLSGDEGSDDHFNWTVYAPDGTPLAALRFASKDGSLLAVNAAGEAQSLEAVLARECEHRFEITLHLDDGAWSVSMDGVAILERSPLGLGEGVKPVFGDAAAAWEPGLAGKPAGMVFDDFEVTVTTPVVQPAAE